MSLALLTALRSWTIWVSLSLFKMLHLLSHQKPLLCQIQSLLFRLHLTHLSEAWSPASPSRDILFTSVTAHSLPPQSPWVSLYLWMLEGFRAQSDFSHSWWYFLFFISISLKGTEIQRGEVTCLRTHSQYVALESLLHHCLILPFIFRCDLPFSSKSKPVK